MLHRHFGPWTFMRVGTIDPARTPEGTVSEFMPQARYAKAKTTPLNPHGGGPFCRFVVPDAPHRSGVYVLTADDKMMYVGKARDLDDPAQELLRGRPVDELQDQRCGAQVDKGQPAA
jgi:hypothetical protein